MSTLFNRPADKYGLGAYSGRLCDIKIMLFQEKDKVLYYVDNTLDASTWDILCYCVFPRSMQICSGE